MDYPRYDPGSALMPLTELEFDAMDQLLQGLADDGAMPLDGLDGYLTALLIGARRRLTDGPASDWLPEVWGGDGPEGPDVASPFASKRQRKDTVVRVLRHLRHLDEQLARQRDDWEPIFSIAERGAQELIDSRDWCAGFLQAVDADPAAWPVDWADPVFSPIVQLGGGLEGEAPDGFDDVSDPVACDRLSRAVPEAVLALLGAHQAAAQGTP